MDTKTFFPYYWHIDEDEPNITMIRIYGLDENNKNICVLVNNFTPYIYLELPKPYNQWNENTAQMLGSKLDRLLGDNKPILKILTKKYKFPRIHLYKCSIVWLVCMNPFDLSIRSIAIQVNNITFGEV